MQNTKNKLQKIFMLVLIICFVCFFIISQIILYNNYKHTKKDIAKLQKQLLELKIDGEYLKLKIDQYANYYNYQTEYSNDAYNYLAIGNSLTIIPGLERGICSTKPDNDYFNLVIKNLSNNKTKITAYPYNFAIWEMSNKRKSTLNLLDVYLDKKLNLVSIQLGENVKDNSTFEKDLIELINYVKTKAPNAKIIVIGDFWSKKRNLQRKNAAKITNLTFVDLDKIIGDKSFQSNEGNICLLKDGTNFKVTKEMATHPGDKGMQYIANEILKALSKNENKQ